MSDALDQRLLEALLDSWDRNNTILLNLLRALPVGGLEARAMEGSPVTDDEAGPVTWAVWRLKK